MRDLDSGTVVDVEQMNERLAAEMQWAKQAMVQEQKVAKSIPTYSHGIDIPEIPATCLSTDSGRPGRTLRFQPNRE